MAITVLLLTSVIGRRVMGGERVRSRSHAALRGLPMVSRRPPALGPVRFVDPRNGDDAAAGGRRTPWKTIAHALTQLQPGQTLYLRGGVHYESPRINLKGEPRAPITIRSHPGELAVIDAGYREFAETPRTAWESGPGGVAGEYRSTKSYRRGGNFGNFADSMVPFQRYLTFADLRSRNELWHRGLSNRAADPTGIYAGPGVRRNASTGRVHIRLAHTKLAGLGKNHYRGETDPRKLPLVIAGADYGIEFTGAKHVTIQDIVVRGAARSAVGVSDSAAIQLDGVTLYGSGSALRANRVDGLRVTGSRLRGHAAPWHSRGHHKDRAGAGYLVVCGGREIELAWCELTDHHDGVLMKDAVSLRFHHNLVDNFNDDGLEPGPKVKSRRIFIYQNRITRCLNTFTAHGRPQPIGSDPHSGVYVYRNIVDLRRGVYKVPPIEPDPSGAYGNRIGTIAHDHGSPTWAVYYVYHNTFVLPSSSWRNYYAFGWGSHMRATKRRVFNNVFVQVEGMPSLNFHSIAAENDFRAGGNLLWGLRDGPRYAGDFFAKFRATAKFHASRKLHPPGWTKTDLFADPRFAGFDDDPTVLADVRLKRDSLAIDAGVRLPEDWPDPLKNSDQGRADIGALPLGSARLRAGPAARPDRKQDPIKRPLRHGQ